MALPMETIASSCSDSNKIPMHEANGTDLRSSRWDDRIDKGSMDRIGAVTSPCPPNTGGSCCGSPGNSKNGHVCFKSIRIKQYERILGDHPSCSAGAPIAIGWTILQDEIVDIDEYERRRTLSRKASLAKLALCREERATILSEWGVTNREMVASIRSISKVKRQRRRTAQTCYDGLEEVFEKASRHIKNGLIQRIPICRSPKLLNNKVSNRNIAQRRLSENSKETVDSDPASLSKDLRYISNQEYAPTLDCVVNPIQYELRQMGHSLTEMLRSTSSERLHPCFKKSACSEMNASPPKRITNREPGSLSFCNNEKAELSSRTSGDSSLGASFPQSSIGSYCDWEGTESSITSIVECDFDSEHFSENTL